MAICYVKDLYQHVKRYKLNDALATISQASGYFLHKGAASENAGGTTITFWQLAFLAKALILNANDYKSKKFDDKALKLCADMYNNLYEPLSNPSRDDPLSIESYYLRTAYEQLPYQEKHWNLVPRTLYLYNYLNNVPKAKRAFDISKTIQGLYQLSIEDLLIIGCCAAASVKKGGYFDPKNIINTLPNRFKGHLTEDKVKHFLQEVVLDYQNFREKAREEERKVPLGLEKYAFNPLRGYPIIKTDQKKNGKRQYVIPVPLLLLRRITDGVYYDLFAKYKDRFSQFFGLVFEEYVGSLLGEFYDNDHLIREPAYGKPLKKGPDWIILEDSHAILIECTINRLTKKIKSLGDFSELQKKLQQKLVSCIEKYPQKIEDIKTGKTGIPNYDRITSFYSLIVVLDPLYGANSIVRDLISSELRKEEMNNFSYQILWIGELEDLCVFKENEQLSSVLDRKIRDFEKSDFHDLSIVYSREKGIDLKNKLLARKFWEFLGRKESA
jgi:hypothetical protein